MDEEINAGDIINMTICFKHPCPKSLQDAPYPALPMLFTRMTPSPLPIDESPCIGDKSKNPFNKFQDAPYGT